MSPYCGCDAIDQLFQVLKSRLHRHNLPKCLPKCRLWQLKTTHKSSNNIKYTLTRVVPKIAVRVCIRPIFAYVVNCFRLFSSTEWPDWSGDSKPGVIYGSGSSCTLQGTIHNPSLHLYTLSNLGECLEQSDFGPCARDAAQIVTRKKIPNSCNYK